jgi:hypothetical protein
MARNIKYGLILSLIIIITIVIYIGWMRIMVHIGADQVEGIDWYDRSENINTLTILIDFKLIYMCN